MAANKTRKVLTETDLLSILESTEAELLAADKELAKTSDAILDGIFEPGIFQKLVKAGTYQASTVRVGDKPAFVMIHNRNDVGWLVIDGAVCIGRAPLRHLFEGGEALARHLKAPRLVFVTKLKGLYDYAQRQDWKTIGVIVSKAIREAISE